MKPKYKRMLEGMQKKRRRKKGEPWFLYIIECSDGSFYTGVTKDIDRRLEEHNAGKASKYTRLRLPVRLRYSEECAGRTARPQENEKPPADSVDLELGDVLTAPMVGVVQTAVHTQAQVAQQPIHPVEF